MNTISSAALRLAAAADPDLSRERNDSVEHAERWRDLAHRIQGRLEDEVTGVVENLSQKAATAASLARFDSQSGREHGRFLGLTESAQVLASTFKAASPNR